MSVGRTSKEDEEEEEEVFFVFAIVFAITQRSSSPTHQEFEK